VIERAGRPSVPSMRRFALLVLTLAGACTNPSRPHAPAADGSRDRDRPAQAYTRCDDDGDCLLTCERADDCCTPQCCDQAMHGADVEKIRAAKRDCSTFDYATCAAATCDPATTYVATCQRRRCVAEKVEGKPPPPPIDTRDYDRSCRTDDDCTLVQTQPCAKCGCPDVPLATRERERFAAALGAVKCPPYDPWPDIDCGSCMSPEVSCEAGQCVVGR
jgi:hypothetical protein